jgi:hypothetical protein
LQLRFIALAAFFITDAAFALLSNIATCFATSTTTLQFATIRPVLHKPPALLIKQLSTMQLVLALSLTKTGAGFAFGSSTSQVLALVAHGVFA